MENKKVIALSIFLILSVIFNLLLIVGHNEIQNEHELVIINYCEYSNDLIDLINIELGQLKLYDFDAYGESEPLKKMSCFR